MRWKCIFWDRASIDFRQFVVMLQSFQYNCCFSNLRFWHIYVVFMLIFVFLCVVSCYFGSETNMFGLSVFSSIIFWIVQPTLQNHLLQPKIRFRHFSHSLFVVGVRLIVITTSTSSCSSFFTRELGVRKICRICLSSSVAVVRNAWQTKLSVYFVRSHAVQPVFV